MNTGQILDSLPNDQERADWCTKRAGEARNKYLQGKQESIDYVVGYKGWRWRRFNRAERESIGVERWRTHVVAVGLANDEQMFTRWANMYALRAIKVTLAS